jgi:hypothetical protein
MHLYHISISTCQCLLKNTAIYTYFILNLKSNQHYPQPKYIRHTECDIGVLCECRNEICPKVLNTLILIECKLLMPLMSIEQRFECDL